MKRDNQLRPHGSEIGPGDSYRRLTWQERGEIRRRKARRLAKRELRQRGESTRAPSAGLAPGLIPIEAIATKKVQWIWPGRIPRGKVAVLAGSDKAGKTFLVCKIAAIISNGARWPLSEGSAKVGSVIIISPEDDPADTLRPRLEAAGAVLNRVFVLPPGKLNFNLEEGSNWLAGEIREIKRTRKRRVRLIAFDPATAVLGSINRNDGNAIRGLLTRLGRFADKHKLAILLTGHLNKSRSVTGSFEWLAASRAAFLVTRQADTGDRLFVPRPSTLSKERPAIAFRIWKNRNELAPRVQFRKHPVEISFDEALMMGARKQQRRDRASSPATHWLSELLQKGPMDWQNIVKLGRREGFTPKMLRTARETLEAIWTRLGGPGSKGRTVWQLPSKNAVK
jgi:AAA domain